MQKECFHEKGAQHKGHLPYGRCPFVHGYVSMLTLLMVMSSVGF